MTIVWKMTAIKIVVVNLGSDGKLVDHSAVSADPSFLFWILKKEGKFFYQIIWLLWLIGSSAK